MPTPTIPGAFTAPLEGAVVQQGQTVSFAWGASTIPGGTPAEAAPDAITGLTLTELAAPTEAAPDAIVGLTLTEVTAPTEVAPDAITGLTLTAL